jgi:thiaminase (transcriptional activator TenA)
MSTTRLFSRQAWDKNASIYEVIRTMPFNAQLASGTLSEARFKHYITQDAHYLIGFGRALTLAAAKAPEPDRIVQFAKAAEGALVVERALHGSFFKQYAIAPQAFAQTPLSPACHHYVSYLLATAYGEPYEVLLGALLPCFWIYAEVGRDIHARARPANPYQAWIDTYAGEEFHAAVRAVIVAADEAAAEERDELTAAAHSITSSAMASSPGGKLRPNALAVLRLITNSNLLDCMTGRSAGFSPLRIRPVYTPAWRYASVMLVP